MTTTLTVEGMGCDGCEDIVENALTDVDGVLRTQRVLMGGSRDAVGVSRHLGRLRLPADCGRRLRRLPNVEDASADYEADAVTLEGDADPEELREAVEFAGYEATVGE